MARECASSPQRSCHQPRNLLCRQLPFWKTVRHFNAVTCESLSSGASFRFRLIGTKEKLRFTITVFNVMIVREHLGLGAHHPKCLQNSVKDV